MGVASWASIEEASSLHMRSNDPGLKCASLLRHPPHPSASLPTPSSTVQVVFEGKLNSLRRIKDNVEEVSEGLECGIGAEGFLDWQPGDSLECYQVGVGASRQWARAVHAGLAARLCGLPM